MPQIVPITFHEKANQEVFTLEVTEVPEVKGQDKPLLDALIFLNVNASFAHEKNTEDAVLDVMNYFRVHCALFFYYNEFNTEYYAALRDKLLVEDKTISPEKMIKRTNPNLLPQLVNDMFERNEQRHKHYLNCLSKNLQKKSYEFIPRDLKSAFESLNIDEETTTHPSAFLQKNPNSQHPLKHIHECEDLGCTFHKRHQHTKDIKQTLKYTLGKFINFNVSQLNGMVYAGFAAGFLGSDLPYLELIAEAGVKDITLLFIDPLYINLLLQLQGHSPKVTLTEQAQINILMKGINEFTHYFASKFEKLSIHFFTNVEDVLTFLGTNNLTIQALIANDIFVEQGSMANEVLTPHAHADFELLVQNGLNKKYGLALEVIKDDLKGQIYTCTTRYLGDIPVVNEINVISSSNYTPYNGKFFQNHSLEQVRQLEDRATNNFNRRFTI